MNIYVLIISCFIIMSCNNKREVTKDVSSTNKTVLEKEQKPDKTVNTQKWDTIRGYFNNDKEEDLIVSYYNSTKGEFYYKVLFKIENAYSVSKTDTINDDFSYLVNEGVGAVLLYKNKISGSYGIRISCCANHKEYEDYIYQFNSDKQRWDLIKTIEYTRFPKISFKIAYPTYKDSTNFEKKLNNLLDESKIRYATKDIKWIEEELNDLFEIGEIIENIRIDKQNVIKLNDIAYFLEQTNKGDHLAIYILEKVISEFPNRTVAYINLGDAYWGLEEKEKAKEAYKTYIEQMKTNGKETKIPKRLLERV
ncbi:tetratricopeptide repeat protein [uncultured Aquimarina sp.]|uniref:tetratricopeptide repeat protein n=1 Tax=uncultured Aquimarina sp. TaxID=575652 RepID=UPI00262067BD|nr:tetratricopeptide repeat protein [uncultured Aquimarina sp.]